jgi:hypothetical protein
MRLAMLDLKDQLRRASSSVALNCAEGAGKTGADRERFFLIARGSSLECAAIFDVLLTHRVVSKEQPLPQPQVVGRPMSQQPFAANPEWPDDTQRGLHLRRQ